MKHYFIPLLLLLAACGGPTGKKSEPQSPTLHQEPEPQRVLHFQPALPDADMGPEERREFLRKHFWDHFDFADSTLLVRIDSAELVQAYITYVGMILRPDDADAMRRLMERTDRSKAMLGFFHRLGEQLLYDPNSPMRSDELYIPVLEQVAASPHYDKYEKLAPAYELELVRQNRVGHPANDFLYTLSDGTQGRLYDLRAHYTLLFISNPGCPMCRSIREAVCESPLLSEMQERGEMQVLMLYPDRELDEWYKHQSEIPKQWINAYDKGCILQRNRLYDLKAIPSLYLLDRNKRVILKDVVDVPLIEERLLELR